MNRLLPRVSMALAAIAFTATSAVASPITYTVSRVIGAGSVSGTIVTDGTIGVLAAGNLLTWNLVLNDGTGPFTVLGPTSGNNSQVFVSGTSFTATSSGLFFNYSGVGIVLFQNPFIGSGMNFWCLDDSSGGCNSIPSTDSVRTSGPQPGTFVARAGTQQVASAAVAVVPEPATALLTGLGLVALAGRRLIRRR